MTDSLESTAGGGFGGAAGDPTVRAAESGPEAFWVPDQAHIISVEPRKPGGSGRWKPVLGILGAIVVLAGLVVGAIVLAGAIGGDDEEAPETAAPKENAWTRQSPAVGGFNVDMPKALRDERTTVTPYGSVTSSILIADRGRWDLIVAESRFPDGAEFDLQAAAEVALGLVEGEVDAFTADSSGILEAADVEGVGKRGSTSSTVVGRLQALPHGAAVYLVVGPSGEAGMRADLERVLESSSVNE